MKIIISSGSNKFHMAPLAAEISKGNHLAAFVTAGWPIGIQEKFARIFNKNPSWQRFLDRKEPIPESITSSFPFVDLILKLSDKFFKKNNKNRQQEVYGMAFRYYARRAAKIVEKVRPDLYHYRNCYGLTSVSASAKRHKIIALCDHSIAHPICLHWMENNSGSWPKVEQFQLIEERLSPLKRMMKHDLDIADYVVVNSDFVKDTCLHVGMQEDKIFVVYLGVDEKFFSLIPSNRRYNLNPRLLYAGGWQQRKGVATLCSALRSVDRDWSLTIAGGVDRVGLLPADVDEFFSNSKVDYRGTLTRPLLAKVMSEHDIFVFPSYCEGSARVIFEAMASGCYIITTKNSGSIVENGIHGALVRENDANELAIAVKYALDNPREVQRVGVANKKLVAEKFRQNQYAARMMNVYQRLMLID